MTCTCFYEDECECPAREAAYLEERTESDARGLEAVELEAHAEDYDRDWSEALHDHDVFCNRCLDADQFGARCWKRKGHNRGHDSTVNGMVQFIYSEEKVNALVYTDNPLLAMVRR